MFRDYDLYRRIEKLEESVRYKPSACDVDDVKYMITSLAEKLGLVYVIDAGTHKSCFVKKSCLKEEK